MSTYFSYPRANRVNRNRSVLRTNQIEPKEKEAPLDFSSSVRLKGVTLMREPTKMI